MAAEKPGRRRLGEIVQAAGLVTREQLADALEYQRLWGHKLGTALVAKRYITEYELIQVLARELRLETADPCDIDIPREVLDLVPAKVAARHDLVPIAVEQEGSVRRLVIAMSDPLNLDAIPEVRAIARMDVRPVIATMSSVARAVRERYGQVTAASRLAAFADGEMVVVQPGGDELVVGPDGSKELRGRDPNARPTDPGASVREPDASGDTTLPRGRLRYPGEAPEAPAAPPPMPGYAPAPYPPPMPAAMAAPPLGYVPAPGYPAGYVSPPPTPPPGPTWPPAPPAPAPAWPPAAYAPPITYVPATAAPDAPTMRSGPAAAAPAPQGSMLAVMDEISRASPMDLMMALVRALLRRGLLQPEELLAELRRRG